MHTISSRRASTPVPFHKCLFYSAVYTLAYSVSCACCVYYKLLLVPVMHFHLFSSLVSLLFSLFFFTLSVFTLNFAFFLFHFCILLCCCVVLYYSCCWCYILYIFLGRVTCRLSKQNVV